MTHRHPLAVAIFVLLVSVSVSAQTPAEVAALRAKAVTGDATAQYNLGVMHDDGTGVPQDYSQAAAWYHKAADQGNAGAQFRLGWMFYTGRVPKDLAQAATWFKKAAEQGHPSAQYYLAGMYSSGLGLPQEYAQAVAWYRKGAEQGSNVSQNSLAHLYALGQGVPQDYVTAHMWMNLSAASADVGVMRNQFARDRDELAKQMTPQQIAEAQKRASEWLAAFEKRKKN